MTQEIIKADTPMEERGPQAQLSQDTMTLGDQILAAYPEIQMVMLNLWYPKERPLKEPGKVSRVATAICSRDGDPTTDDDLKDFLDELIYNLCQLRQQMNNPLSPAMRSMADQPVEQDLVQWLKGLPMDEGHS